MSNNVLKINKLLKEVTLWIHPEGPVIGSLFLQPQDENETGEVPEDVLNQDDPFVVLKSDTIEDIRFYSRSSIVRATYSGNSKDAADSEQQFQCQLLMMDGSLIKGRIRENLQPEYARLYDYLNKDRQRFIKIVTDENDVCLVNKSYIIQVIESPT